MRAFVVVRASISVLLPKVRGQDEWAPNEGKKGLGFFEFALAVL